jgi:hypothetical protein
MSDARRITGFSMGHTVIFVSYRTLPGQIDEAIAAIGALIATVQAVEPDCTCGSLTSRPSSRVLPHF